jgi:hypothetical protein
MAVSTNDDPEGQYVASLRWRQQDLQGKLEAIGAEIASLTRSEADFKQQLRAIEQLLVAAGESAVSQDPLIASTPHRADGPPRPNGANPDADDAPFDFSAWGPKSRAIYTTAAEVIRDAGVPLHYRVLADEVQKKVALSGADPGATLIAHLNRAQDVFPRVGRGIYGLEGLVTAPVPSATSAGASSKRRPRTRRRTG